MLRNEGLKFNSVITQEFALPTLNGEKRNRNQLPSIFTWSKPTVERRKLKRVIQLLKKNTEKENELSVITLHTEIQESEISLLPTCNAILEAGGAGFHHSCVFCETVGTQTDEPMDVSE